MVITSYHRPKTFIECVSSVLKATHNPIYVIDNSEGQIDPELRWAEKQGITIFKTPKNVGKPQAIVDFWNEIPQHQWFITMDPDVIIPENGVDQFIGRINGLCEQGYPICLATPALEYDHRTWLHQMKKQNLVMHNWHEMVEIQDNVFYNRSLAGCLMLVSTPIYNQLGGYQPTRLYNDDDGWLCNESIKLNLMNVIDGNLVCKHDLSEETPEYRAWKDRNSTQQVDKKGLWDQ